MKELQNMKAIITGGSSGIGQAIAIAYARAGADVVISYCHNEKGVEKTLALIEAEGRKAKAIRVDMTCLLELQALIKEGVAFLDGIDIFVNNAGTLTRHADFLEIPLDAFDQVQAVNFKAPFMLTQLVGEQMQKQGKGGSIINISSVSASIISPGLTHYECSKAALNMLTRASASALAKYRIRVNAIAPGLVETNINQAQRDHQPEIWEQRKTMIPLNRAGKPEDIAHMAVLLASNKSAWITGDIISVDGGISLKNF